MAAPAAPAAPFSFGSAVGSFLGPVGTALGGALGGLAGGLGGSPDGPVSQSTGPVTFGALNFNAPRSGASAVLPWIVAGVVALVALVIFARRR